MFEIVVVFQGRRREKEHKVCLKWNYHLYGDESDLSLLEDGRIRDETRLSDGHKNDLIGKIVKSYQSLIQSRSRNTDRAKSERSAFLADMNNCLNFGVSNLCDKLLTDRVRSNLGVTVEDVDFLDDPLGPRQG